AGGVLAHRGQRLTQLLLVVAEGRQLSLGTGCTFAVAGGPQQPAEHHPETERDEQAECRECCHVADDASSMRHPPDIRGCRSSPLPSVPCGSCTPPTGTSAAPSTVSTCSPTRRVRCG